MIICFRLGSSCVTLLPVIGHCFLLEVNVFVIPRSFNDRRNRYRTDNESRVHRLHDGSSKVTKSSNYREYGKIVSPISPYRPIQELLSHYHFDFTHWPVQYHASEHKGSFYSSLFQLFTIFCYSVSVSIKTFQKDPWTCRSSLNHYGNDIFLWDERI